MNLNKLQDKVRREERVEKKINFKLVIKWIK